MSEHSSDLSKPSHAMLQSFSLTSMLLTDSFSSILRTANRASHILAASNNEPNYQARQLALFCFSPFFFLFNFSNSVNETMPTQHLPPSVASADESLPKGVHRAPLSVLVILDTMQSLRKTVSSSVNDSSFSEVIKLVRSEWTRSSMGSC